MNRLSDSASPYLRQHANNPVHWWPWCDEAFKAATTQQKPVLLSIGYAACHWCHVMAHESFEDETTAAVMNDLFVNIKVDREERPDIDQFYMAALHQLGQQGGWPLTMFLDDQRQPFWGGTYFPDRPRYGQPAFQDVLRAVHKTYHTEPARIAHNRDAIIARLAKPSKAATPAPSITDPMVIAQRLTRHFDTENGGLKGAPKFPQYPLLDFLWRMNAESRDHVANTLRQICLGGIYDHIGGGFARYSVDAVWLIPHFEKMLYDNALLLRLLARIARHKKQDLFRIRIEETIAFLDSALAKGSVFMSSLDADTEDGEGYFYSWTPEQTAEFIGETAPQFNAAYDISKEGNFEGRSIPNLLTNADPIADIAAHQDARAILLTARQARPAPDIDEKINLEWNAYLVTAFAEIGAALHDPAMIKRGQMLFDALVPDPNRLSRLHHIIGSNGPLFASDLAALLEASLSLFEQTGEETRIDIARAILTLLDEYRAPAGGYAMTPINTHQLPATMIQGNDDATPNPSALIADMSAKLFHAFGETTDRDRCEAIIQAFAKPTAQNPVAHTGLLSAQHHLNHGGAIFVDPSQDQKTLNTYRNVVRDHGAGIVSLYLVSDIPAIWNAKPVASGALLCAAGICHPPFITPETLANHLQADKKIGA